MPLIPADASSGAVEYGAPPAPAAPQFGAPAPAQQTYMQQPYSPQPIHGFQQEGPGHTGMTAQQQLAERQVAAQPQWGATRIRAASDTLKETRGLRRLIALVIIPVSFILMKLDLPLPSIFGSSESEYSWAEGYPVNELGVVPFEIIEGSCIQNPHGSGAGGKTFTEVPCTEPYWVKIYRQSYLTEEDLAGGMSIAEATGSACLEAYSALANGEDEVEELGFDSYYPTQAQWDLGVRTITCGVG